MKRILMIGTGGTIASEMTPDGLTPELNTEQLLEFIPDIGKLCLVDCLQLYSLDSTNIRPENWLGIVEILRKSYDAYDGFVISHGTDTMAYTAAALSYLVQGSAKPIVLTGAQKPIWFDGTDSKRNLTDAFLYACRGCGGVQIVFNGKVILGTRARKTFSKSFQAFSSVNYPDLAVLQDERLLQYIRTESLPRPVFYDKLCENVGLLKLIPGTRRELVDFMMERYDGIVVESFGVGGLPEYPGEEFYPLVQRAVERGKIVVRLLNVTRGYWNTEASSHSTNDTIYKLQVTLNYGYDGVIPNMALQDEIAEVYAEIASVNGIRYYDFVPNHRSF